MENEIGQKIRLAGKQAELTQYLLPMAGAVNSRQSTARGQETRW